MYSSRMTSDGVLRIGELSKRAGVSPELLRAWERRYGLLRPTRSSGGHSFGEVLSHQTHALDIGRRVEAEAAA